MSDIIKLAHIVPQRGSEDVIYALAAAAENDPLGSAYANEILVSTHGFGYMQPETGRPVPLKTRFAAANAGVLGNSINSADLFLFELNNDKTQKAVRFDKLVELVGLAAGEFEEQGGMRWLFTMDEQAPPQYIWTLQEPVDAFAWHSKSGETITKVDLSAGVIPDEYTYTVNAVEVDGRPFLKLHLTEVGVDGSKTGQLFGSLQLDHLAAFIEDVVDEMDTLFDGKLPYKTATDEAKFLNTYLRGWSRSSQTGGSLGSVEAIDITTLTSGDITGSAFKDLFAFQDGTWVLTSPFIVPLEIKSGTSPDSWQFGFGLDGSLLKSYVDYKLSAAEVDFTVIDGGTWT